MVPMTSLAIAQEGTLSFNVPPGYTFKERVKSGAAYGDVNDCFQYVAGLEYFTGNASSIDLNYQRVGVDFPLYGPTGNKLSVGDESGSVNYILPGGKGYFGKSYDAKTQPFFGGGV
jgi:hypothetical protein